MGLSESDHQVWCAYWLQWSNSPQVIAQLRIKNTTESSEVATVEIPRIMIKQGVRPDTFGGDGVHALAEQRRIDWSHMFLCRLGSGDGNFAGLARPVEGDKQCHEQGQK